MPNVKECGNNRNSFFGGGDGVGRLHWIRVILINGIVTLMFLQSFTFFYTQTRNAKRLGSGTHVDLSSISS